MMVLSEGTARISGGENKVEKDTTTLEQQIDNLVYRLYDLTYDEVKVVDPEFGLSREEYEAIEVG